MVGLTPVSPPMAIAICPQGRNPRLASPSTPWGADRREAMPIGLTGRSPPSLEIKLSPNLFKHFRCFLHKRYQFKYIPLTFSVILKKGSGVDLPD